MATVTSPRRAAPLPVPARMITPWRITLWGAIILRIGVDLLEDLQIIAPSYYTALLKWVLIAVIVLVAALAQRAWRARLDNERLALIDHTIRRTIAEVQEQLASRD